MLVSAIITELVSEVGGDAGDTEFSDKMFGIYKAGLRRIPAFIKDRLFVTEGTLPLSAGAITADLSTLSPAFIKERAIWYIDGSGGRIAINQAESVSAFNNYYSPDSSGYPMVYKIYGKQIRFNTKAVATLTIGIDYFKEVSNILTTDTFFGNEQTAEVSKEMCKRIYYKDYAEDMVKAQASAQDAAALLSELQADYEALEMGGYVQEGELL